MPQLTIVLLSGGGHTGLNVLGALAGRRSALRLVACSDATDEPTLFAYDAIHVVPTLANDPINFERRILDILVQERADLVIPCRDEDVAWLARFGQQHPEYGRRLLCGAPEIAEMADDKWLSHEFSRRHDLPFAATFVCGQSLEGADGVVEFVRAQGLPVVSKPRRGAEGRGIRLITDIDQAIRSAEQEGNVLQQYLGAPDATDHYLKELARSGIPLFHSFEGVKRSLQVLIGPHGDVPPIALATL